MTLNLFTAVECRAITRRRVQLGDSSKDVWEYHIYSFLGHRDFDLQQYSLGSMEPCCIVAREPGVLDLGGQYAFKLSDEPPGPGLNCRVAVWNKDMRRYDAAFKAIDNQGVEWWPSLHWYVQAAKDLGLKVGRTYYLSLA